MTSIISILFIFAAAIIAFIAVVTEFDLPFVLGTRQLQAENKLFSITIKPERIPVIQSLKGDWCVG